MTVKDRLEKSATTGLLAAGAVTGFAATRRHAALAAAAAQSSAHGQHESVRQILVTGFIGIWVIAASAVFTIATVLAVGRRRRLLRSYARGSTATGPTYTGYSSHRGRW